MGHGAYNIAIITKTKKNQRTIERSLGYPTFAEERLNDWAWAVCRVMTISHPKQIEA